MKKKVYYAIGAALVAIVALIVVASGQKEQKPLLAEQKETYRYVAAEGKVEVVPGYETLVGSELIERIERFHVKEGDRVDAGDPVVTLESSNLRAQLKEAEEELKVAKARLLEASSGARTEEIAKAKAVLEAAKADLELDKKNLDRYRELFDKGLIPASDIDEKERAFGVSRASLDAAKEELKLLEAGPKKETVSLYKDALEQSRAHVEYVKTMLSKTIIRSPISGTVIHKNLEQGEIVIPEVPLLTVADVDRLWINAEVDETDASRIALGQEVDVTSDAFRGALFKGEIAEIAHYVGSREITPNDTTKNVDMKVIKVKVRLKDKTPFKIGMTVDVRVLPDAIKSPIPGPASNGTEAKTDEPRK